MTLAPLTEPAREGTGGPFRTRLAELVWYRALTGAGRPYLTAAAGGRCVTYTQLRRVTDRWTELLDDLGVPAGAGVGLAMADPLDFSLAFLGVIAGDRVAAPLDPRGTDEELLGVFRRIRPHLVVSDRPAPQGYAGEWLVVPAAAFSLESEPANTATGLTADVPAAAPAGPGTGSAGLLLSTSGTTGAPKCIRLGEDQLLHTAAAVAAHHRLTIADRGFNPLPLFHINAEVVGLLATLSAGSALVLDDRFHRTGFWDTMARHHVTWINAVPAILARLVPLAAGETVPAEVRFARSASAPLPLAVLERFERSTGVSVVETYGMTEAASQITANPVDGERRPGSVGQPVGTEVVVRAAPGAVGPVAIRGRGVIVAYAGPGYEGRFDAEGWLDTGDIGYVDDGWLYLVGRGDDVVNCGGEKVYPREVEEVILGDPDVMAVAVAGEDHQVLGQVPVAYVVVASVRDEADRRRAEDLVRRLEARCTSALSKPKRPAAYHVVARLPEGTNGKLRRHAVGGEPAIYSLLVR